jgi:hypothetical protein
MALGVGDGEAEVEPDDGAAVGAPWTKVLGAAGTSEAEEQQLHLEVEAARTKQSGEGSRDDGAVADARLMKNLARSTDRRRGLQLLHKLYVLELVARTDG